MGGLATLSLPGLAPFVSEFLVLVGTFSAIRWAIIATGGIILAALYVLCALPAHDDRPGGKPEIEGMPDLKARDWRWWPRCWR